MSDLSPRVKELLRTHRRAEIRRLAWGLLLFLLLYLVAAYLVVPFFWKEVEGRQAGRDLPDVTRTSSGIPGDPLNVLLVGTEVELLRALNAAGWTAADPITFRTSLRISESVVFDRPDPAAPVSSLYLWGRRQDLAFEQAVGQSARHRHHVRFWQTPLPAEDGRPQWVGAATFDTGAGLSHRTGELTHHIAADIDAERDHLMETLRSSEQLVNVERIPGRGPTENGRNGNGDRYFTDGEMAVGVLGR